MEINNRKLEEFLNQKYDREMDRFYEKLTAFLPEDVVRKYQAMHLERTSEEDLEKLGRFGWSIHPEDTPSSLTKYLRKFKPTIISLGYQVGNSDRTFYTLTDIFGKKLSNYCLSYEINEDLELISMKTHSSVDFFNGSDLTKICSLNTSNLNEKHKNIVEGVITTENKIAYIFENKDVFMKLDVMNEVVPLLSHFGKTINNSEELIFPIYNFKTKSAETVTFSSEEEKEEYLKEYKKQLEEIIIESTNNLTDL